MAWRVGLIAAVLAGCASVEPASFNGPSGRQAFSMECNGATMDGCYRKAGEICPGGYTVLSNDTRYIAWGGYMVPKRAMAVECK